MLFIFPDLCVCFSLVTFFPVHRPRTCDNVIFFFFKSLSSTKKDGHKEFPGYSFDRILSFKLLHLALQGLSGAYLTEGSFKRL